MTLLLLACTSKLHKEFEQSFYGGLKLKNHALWLKDISNGLLLNVFGILNLKLLKLIGFQLYTKSYCLFRSTYFE